MSVTTVPRWRPSRGARYLRFARNLARWGFPRRSLVFGPLSLGDDLLCTAVLREARRRGAPYAIMTARPELFLGNDDPERILPIDDDFIAGLRRLGARVVQPYYVCTDPSDPRRDVLPGRHIIAEMCAAVGLRGEIALRPYLHLAPAEIDAGRRFPRQITIHSSGLNAAIPYETKEWGAARFVEVARELSAHAKLVQVGAANDPPLPVDLDLRGRTGLRDAAAILAASEVFIGLEGFLAHLARAVDCPAVVVMGGRAATDVFGYPANRNLAAFPSCAPCGLRVGCRHGLACLDAIPPAAVAAAARALLDSPPTRPLVCATAELP